MYERKELSGFEIFGCPIYFRNNMIRLKDIQQAYLRSGGKKSEVATNPSKWLRMESIRNLIDYLEFGDEKPNIKPTTKRRVANPNIIGLPNGDRGGLYVCRELAHIYAGWLDFKYGILLTRAFDKAAQGDIKSALSISNSIVKKVYGQNLTERIERIESKGDYTALQLVSVISEVTSIEIEDPLPLCSYLLDNYDSRILTERLLDSMETAWYCMGSHESALQIVVDKHKHDLHIDILIRIIKDYYGNS